MTQKNGMKLFLAVLSLPMILTNILDSKFDEIPRLNLRTEVALAQKEEQAKKKDQAKTVLVLKDQLKKYCDIFTEGPICLGDGARIISKAMNMHGCIGDFVFDQQIVGVSHSDCGPVGLQQYDYWQLRCSSWKAWSELSSFLPSREIPKHVSHQGVRYQRDYRDYLGIHPKADEERYRKGYPEFTCPIFLKGVDNPEKKAFARAPGIFINQKTGTVYAYASTSDNKEGDYARTLGYLKPRKWNQIAVIYSQKAIKIYLNGVLDGFSLRTGDFLRNKDDIFIGNHPNYIKDCKMELTIDSLKMYNRELFNYEIQAGIRTSMGIIEPSYFHLACFDCTYSEAQSKCVKNYKLCSADDLYSGVWQAAHLMGWTDLDYYIFSDNSEQTGVKGMGICCRQELY